MLAPVLHYSLTGRTAACGSWWGFAGDLGSQPRQPVLGVPGTYVPVPDRLQGLSTAKKVPVVPPNHPATPKYLVSSRAVPCHALPCHCRQLAKAACSFRQPPPQNRPRELSLRQRPTAKLHLCVLHHALSARAVAPPNCPQSSPLVSAQSALRFALLRYLSGRQKQRAALLYPAALNPPPMVSLSRW